MSKTSKKLTIIIIGLLAVTFGLLYNKYTITSFLTNVKYNSSFNNGKSNSNENDYWESAPSSSNNEMDMSFVIIPICILGFILPIFALMPTDRFKLNRKNAIYESEFKSFLKNTDMEEFMADRVTDFIAIQEYWMNFDYEKLRERLTDELYNQYEMELKILSTNGQKNIMKNFVFRDSIITQVNKVNDKYEVTMELIISFINYIEQNGIVISGKPDIPVNMHYELIYTASAKDIVKKCPACHAPLEDTTTQICPYCRHQITQNSSTWVLSKKSSKGIV